MPSVFSKELAGWILGKEWSFGYNCYEVGHTWTPSCTGAAFEISLAAALKIIPLYTMLYVFSQVAVQRKFDLPSSWETIKSILRSSFFIFFHAYNGSLMGCALRRGFGRFYYRVLVCAPALISSYLSLLIEKPSRRQALAFYLLNLASEILFRMAVAKGHFKPLRNGETLLFALSLSAWYYLIKRHGFGRDPVSAVARLLIGREEAKRRPARPNSLVGRKHEPNSASPGSHLFDARKAAGQLLDWLGRKHLGGRHESCPHQQHACLNYVLSPMPSRFLLGVTIQSLLNLARRPLLLLEQPRRALLQSASNRNSINFGLFLASLVSTGRAASCLLRRHSNSNEPHWHAAVSGFLAGLSMLLAPRSSISMYVMWKAVEQYYLLAHKKGYVRHFDFTIMTIYATSAATILYTFALEPKFIRPSYMKFLDRLSDHRLHQLNRMVLDVFGTSASQGYEAFFPDLHPLYMSNNFKELVFNWMIQPY